MQQYWGYGEFRPLQREAMAAVMEGCDSVVVLPTGGGKSLCFQAPAVAMGGMALVVSPLISLMKDQVDALCNCGVAAGFINSTQSSDEHREVGDQIRSGRLKLLYVSPERLLMPRTLDFLSRANVSLIAIDEAHCISSWGHDFRPEYRGLRTLKDAFPNVGIHAYTATASEEVRKDIAKQLGLDGLDGKGPEMLVGSFDRPNLTFRVRPGLKRLAQIQETIHGYSKPGGDHESGIVYCISRKEVDKTAGALKELGVRALPYHAGLSDQQRKKHQEAFLKDRCDVIVATVAFGMGIDKPDVRYVIHAGMPKSLENYQQEAGRAGRDGLASECLMLYSRGDFALWKRIIESPSEEASNEAVAAALLSLDGMTRYCSGVTCRHRALVEHFGQEFESENCGACDVCLGELNLVDNPLILSQKILSCVARLEQRFGADYTVKVLVGSGEERIRSLGHDRLSTYGLLEEHATKDVRDWLEQLVGQGFLERVGEYNVLHLTPTGMKLLKGEGTPQLLRAAAASKGSTSSRRSSKGAAESWEGVDRTLFEELRELRSQLAGELGVPAYIVFGDASLRDLARRRPTSLDTFREAHGVGEKKLRDFGEAFVEAIAGYCTENGVAADVDSEESAPARPAPFKRFDGPNASSLSAFVHFREGLAVDEVAQRMGRARSTTFGYLQDFLKHEKVTDPTPWVDSAITQQVEEAIDHVGLSALKPIHEHLGGEIDYNEIRVVATCVGNREQA